MVKMPIKKRKISNLLRIMRESRLEEVGKGGDRIVYALDDKRVIKIPRHVFGEAMNNNELILYQKDETGRFAAILDVKRPFGVMCVIQERVKVLWDPDSDIASDDVEGVPSWACDLNDDAQVGIAACGSVKVYDYALEGA